MAVLDASAVIHSISPENVSQAAALALLCTQTQTIECTDGCCLF